MHAENCQDGLDEDTVKLSIAFRLEAGRKADFRPFLGLRLRTSIGTFSHFPAPATTRSTCRTVIFWASVAHVNSRLLPSDEL